MRNGIVKNYIFLSAIKANHEGLDPHKIHMAPVIPSGNYRSDRTPESIPAHHPRS